MIDVILVGLISIGVFALFVFVAVREGAINKKLKTYERTFDMLNKELHAIKKELKSAGISTTSMPDFDGKFSTTEEFEEFTNIIITKIHDLQKEHVAFKGSVYEKLNELESKDHFVATTSSAPSPSSSAEEQKIISMFESGFSLEDISKQLRINVGEVEFVLKLNNVRTRSLF